MLVGAVTSPYIIPPSGVRARQEHETTLQDLKKSYEQALWLAESVLEAAEQAQLHISSKLLSLAEIVKTEKVR